MKIVFISLQTSKGQFLVLRADLIASVSFFEGRGYTVITMASGQVIYDCDVLALDVMTAINKAMTSNNGTVVPVTPEAL